MNMIIPLPLAALTLLAVAGCATMPIVPDVPMGPLPFAPFEAPMDPGQIRCSALGNPAALSEATNWAMGRARAMVISGAVSAIPDQAGVQSGLASYCGANRNSTVQTAAQSLGL